MDGDSQPISYSNIRVAAVQNQASLSASPVSLIFSAVPGSTPATQTVNISGGGAATTWAVTSSASWLTTITTSNQTPGAIAVTANPSGLGAGSYSGTLTISAPGATNSPLVIPVTLAVTTAAISVASTSLTFFGAPNSSPAPATVQVTNAGTGNLGWSASNTQSWLSLSPT